MIPNNMKSYKRLGSIINDARLAGMIDWRAIEDRTRNLEKNPTWDSPSAMIADDAQVFHIDLWEDQKYRVEVWIEKDALVGVIEGVCRELDVPFFSCRGYTSQSEMWAAGMRLSRYTKQKQRPVIFHFGDHDPSGKDMTRDITDRLEMFMGGVRLERLALNMDQVEQYNPPPNPAKTTDSRYSAYIAEFGAESWELDALEPRVIAALIRDNIRRFLEKPKWDARVEERAESRRKLQLIADNWERIEEIVEEL